jgi:hypothetical protein
MRRLLASLAAALLSTSLAPLASAQTETGDVSLVLVRQSPWNTPEQPLLRLGVRATNGGAEPIENLSLGITVFSQVLSRTSYELSLREDPDPPVILGAHTVLLRGILNPGVTRTFLLSPTDVSFLAERAETGIYPLKLDLRSNDLPVATIRSPIVFLDLPEHRAKTPLRLAWTFVLDRPVLYGPDGVFDADAVRLLLAPGGRVRQEVNGLAAVLARPHAPPVDLVLSPVLLDQLDTLRQGFRERTGDTVQRVPAGTGAAAVAASLLDQIRKVASAPTVELSALPFSDPSIPSLLAAGLDRDLPTQLQRGRDEVARITGVTPDSEVVRPPRSELDQASLFALWQQGFGVFLVDPTLVRRPAQEKEFAQPAKASLAVSPTETVTAIVPDEGVQNLLASDTVVADPRLATQQVIGELAQVWLERPGVERALAISLPENLALPGDLFQPLMTEIATAPWLRLQKASTIARNFPKPDEPAQLTPPVELPEFPDWYVHTLREVRTDIQTYRSILVRPNPLPDQLETTILVAESSSFADEHRAGASFLESVRDRLLTEFRKVRPDTSPSERTLTSRTGIIPVGVTNQTGYPVKISIRLVSNRLSFLPSNTQPIQLNGDATTILFHVQARTTGRFPVQVQILTPTGVELPAQGQLVVRSTAYNLIALIITIGAALFLLAWWGRRFLPRARAARK